MNYQKAAREIIATFMADEVQDGVAYANDLLRRLNEAGVLKGEMLDEESLLSCPWCDHEYRHEDCPER